MPLTVRSPVTTRSLEKVAFCELSMVKASLVVVVPVLTIKLPVKVPLVPPPKII